MRYYEKILSTIHNLKPYIDNEKNEAMLYKVANQDPHHWKIPQRRKNTSTYNGKEVKVKRSILSVSFKKTHFSYQKSKFFHLYIYILLHIQIYICTILYICGGTSVVDITINRFHNTKGVEV